MRRVLITGGFGYLGGRIGQRLAAESAFMPVLGTRSKECGLPEWLLRGETRHVDLDTEIGDECQGISDIVHLAGLSEAECAANPERAISVNVSGTCRLLDAAARVGVRRFVYMSTIHVYGAPLRGRITEETIPRPQHPYAITHRAAEDFVLAARARGAIEGVAIRLSNGIGVPARVGIGRWELVGNDLIRQAAETGCLRLRSSGEQQRDFISLRDVCEAVTYLLCAPDHTLGDGLYNLGWKSLSILRLAELIADRSLAVLGYRPDIIRPVSDSRPPPAPLDFRADKLLRLGFIPDGNLEREVDVALKFCRDNLR